MIILILGGIGSGKSVTAIKYAVESNKKVLVNFSLKNQDIHRLKVTDIIAEENIGEKRDGTPIIKKKINWDFWKELQGKEFNIFLDEVHNLIHARTSGSNVNILMTKWVSQIRKLLGSSEKNHLYIISQRLNAVDIGFRELAEIIIYCQKYIPDDNDLIKTKIYDSRLNRYKYKMLPKTYVIRYFFIGEFALERYHSFIAMGGKTYDLRLMFLANEYFQYYDSYQIVEFESSQYL